MQTPNFFNVRGINTGIGSGIGAERPTTFVPGGLWLTTDIAGNKFAMSRWNGTTWQNLEGGTGTIDWSQIVNTPTTLAGYGITNAVPTTRTLTIAGTTQDLSANRTFTVSFANLTGKPTTLAGYGITDGVPTTRTLTIAGTTQDLSADRTFTVSFASLTGKPTTLAGYGITNAIVNGTNTAAIAMTCSEATTGVVMSATGNDYTIQSNVTKLQRIQLKYLNQFIRHDVTNALTNVYQNLHEFNCTIQQTGTAGYCAWALAVTETSTGSGTKNLMTVNLGVTPKFNLDRNGNISSIGSLTTDKGTMANSDAWKFGAYRTGAVALDTAHYVDVEIAGTIRKLLIAT